MQDVEPDEDADLRRQHGQDEAHFHQPGGVAKLAGAHHVLHHPLFRRAQDGRLDGGDVKLLGLVSAGGFRDTTRVSMGEPSMWAEILTENAPAVLDRLDEALSQLGEVRNRLASGDKEALRKWLKAAAESRAQALGL